jgi:cyclophilin family peptidyl-prolyl cis-trans isomerase
MPSEKRQRQDEGRLSRRVEMQIEAKRTQRRRQLRGIGILLAALVVGGVIWSVVTGGDDDDPEVATEDSSTSSTASTSSTVAGDATITYPGVGATITGDTPCPAVDGSAERTTSFEKAPPTCIDAAKTYRATLATSEGDIVVELDPEAAPIAVNNFVVLSRYHYYDGVPFHRIMPGFVDQAGTPVDQASPEIETTPGYTLTDEYPDVSGLASPADAYPEGALAMANRGGANTSSSQWFIVVGDGGQQFAENPNYTVFGQVVEGIEIARAINEFGDSATNGTPTKAITVTSVTITEA